MERARSGWERRRTFRSITVSVSWKDPWMFSARKHALQSSALVTPPKERRRDRNTRRKAADGELALRCEVAVGGGAIALGDDRLQPMLGGGLAFPAGLHHAQPAILVAVAGAGVDDTTGVHPEVDGAECADGSART